MVTPLQLPNGVVGDEHLRLARRELGKNGAVVFVSNRKRSRRHLRSLAHSLEAEAESVELYDREANGVTYLVASNVNEAVLWWLPDAPAWER